MVEIPGAHQNIFLYNHPSLANHKSRIDWIYTNMSTQLLCGYTTPYSISDHYLLGLFSVSESADGLKQWRFPSDLLSDNAVVQQIKLTLDNFDKDNSVQSWELIKLKVQNLCQHATRYRQKQARCEITGLKNTLNKLNKKIYARENLDHDRRLIEEQLEQCVDRHKFFLETENNLIGYV